MQPKVSAVIVTYQPDFEKLRLLVAELLRQVNYVVVIDNKSNHFEHIDCEQVDRLRVHFFDKNEGIAKALNFGAELVFNELNQDQCIFFDQDSLPCENMVLILQNALAEICEKGIKTGAVGPFQKDRRTYKYSDVLLPIRYRRKKISHSAQMNPVLVDHLITSGCLVPKEIWLASNGVIDELFIDYVDIEWSLRIRKMGYQLYAIPDAFLWHSIGDNLIEFAHKDIPYHSPLRHYYLIRNGIFLMRQSYVDFSWKFSDALQLLKKFIFFSLFSKEKKFSHFVYMLKGFRDGLFNRMGPWNN